MSVEKRFEIDADCGALVARIDPECAEVVFEADGCSVDFSEVIEFCETLKDTLEGLE